MKLIVFGDSIGDGNYDTEKGGWVNRLRLYFWNNDIKIKIINQSMLGDQLQDVILRIDNNMSYILSKYKPKLKIFFAIGINDSLLDNGNLERKSINKFEEELKIAYNIAKKYTDDITFVGLSKVDEKLTLEYKRRDKIVTFINDRIKEFDYAIENFSKENKLKYIKVYDLLDYKDLYDGLHPNNIGHEKIFKEVLKYIN